MAMVSTSFAAIRDQVRIGDVLAFGGHGWMSGIIKKSGHGSPVSHAATIIEIDPAPVLVESTVRINFHPTYGVSTAPAEAIVDHYDGEVWLLPLSAAVRANQFDSAAFTAYLESKIGGVFDVVGGLRVIIDEFLNGMRELGIVELSARAEAFFCTELVAGALRAAGTAAGVDPEWVSPRDLCRWNIYTADYFHLKGEVLEIPDYNTIAPLDTVVPRLVAEQSLRQVARQSFDVLLVP
jgi:hypothetical protein